MIVWIARVHGARTYLLVWHNVQYPLDFHMCGGESVCAVLAIVWTKLKCCWYTCV